MTDSGFVHSGLSELDLSPGQVVYLQPHEDIRILTTNTIQPLFCAPSPRADCRTCGAPDQLVGARCRYCVHVVAPTVEKR